MQGIYLTIPFLLTSGTISSSPVTGRCNKCPLEIALTSLPHTASYKCWFYKVLGSDCLDKCAFKKVNQGTKCSVPYQSPPRHRTPFHITPEGDHLFFLAQWSENGIVVTICRMIIRNSSSHHFSTAKAKTHSLTGERFIIADSGLSLKNTGKQ